MKRLLIGLMALALTACGYSPPSNQTPTPMPTASAFLIPGTSTIASIWVWPKVARESTDLDAAAANFDSPIKAALWMQKTLEWRDDYDTRIFLSPQETLDAKRGVCSAFARLWVYGLAQHDIKADFIAFWGPSSAHAVAVFRSPLDGRYHMGSNLNYYGNVDLDPGNEGRNAALMAAAREFYGDQWTDLLVFSDAGQVTQRFTNGKASQVPLAPSSAAPGRNLFTVRR